MSNVIEAMKSVFEGECSECGASTHITLVEGTSEFLEEHSFVTSYPTTVWKSDGDRSIDGAVTAVCEFCRETWYVEHVALTGDWVN